MHANRVAPSPIQSTINVGLGGNTGAEGVVVFMNELVPFLDRFPPNVPPNTEDIVTQFDRYEAKHRPRANWSVNMPHYVTRFEAMDIWWLRLLRRLSP
jgi:hypothetical protein